MAGKEILEGQTGLSVRGNIARVRKERDMSWAQMSRFLSKAGRPISALGLRRIEDGSRRVDVDDLMAIAIVLDVTPNDLLLPQRDAGSVSVTGADNRDAAHLWDWAQGRDYLDSEEPWVGFRSGRTSENPDDLGATLRGIFASDDFKRAVREAVHSHDA